MSARDIRSFFKPLTKTNNSSKQQSSSGREKNGTGLAKKSTQKSEKSEEKVPRKIESISSDSDDQNLCSKNGQTEKTKKGSSKKIEAVSSNYDKNAHLSSKNSQHKKIRKGDSRKIEVVSSDSDNESHIPSKSDNSKRKSKIPNNEKGIAKNIDKSSNEDSDIIESTPVKTTKTIRGKHILSSDSEDERPHGKVAKVQSFKTKDKMQEKLKPVSINNIFSKTVKQSQLVYETPSKTPEVSIKKSNKKTKGTTEKNTELGIHKDVDFEKTLIDLDDDIFLQNEDILDKTIESAMANIPAKIPSKKESKDVKDIPSNQNSNPRKRTLENNSSEKDDTPSKSKKTKLDHVDSGIDDQERYEKRKYCAVQYQQYLNRSGPKNHGCKELPKGKPDCLANLCFLKTGVLDSLESEEFRDLIKQHGGRTVQAVSKKVDYVIAGDDAGPAKLEKARSYQIPIIDEDELLDMILQKSGMPKKYTVSKTYSFEDAGMSDSFKSVDNEMSVESKVNNIESTADESDNKKFARSKEKKELKQIPERVTPEQTAINIQEVKDTVSNDNEVIDESGSVKVDDANFCLSEKYKPKDLKQIVGQQVNNSNMNKLKKWLDDWHVNEKLRKQKKIPQPTPWSKNHDGGYYKCALLSGPPGVGKTTTATLVGKSLGHEIIEFNASDTRSKTLLRQEVATALTTQNIHFGKSENNVVRKVILMDEVDGMAGNEDRGGMQELINLIKQTKIPIICMCNDRNHQKMRTLSNYCFDLRFDKPKPQQILGFVMSICCKENIKVTSPVLMEIINGTTCDIRQTLNQISMIANLDDGVTIEQAQKDSAAAKKDTVLGPWQVCKMVFDEASQKNMSLIDKSRLFFYDYSMGPLFVQENYLKVQPKVERKKLMKHVAIAAEAISMGATIDQKIRQFNNWSLLDTQAIFSSVLPGHYMSGHFVAAIDFPSYLGKYSKRNKHKRLNNELALHTRLQTSGGALAMNLDYSKALLNSIVTPLKKRGLDGVSEAVEIMKSYQLLRIDLDNLVELCTWPKQKSIMAGIESNVKMAFTRLYNKEVPIFSYSANDATSKKRSAALYDDELNEGETEELSDTDDKIGNDNLIKIKRKSKSQSKKETSKPSSSKQRSKTKGKAKK